MTPLVLLKVYSAGVEEYPAVLHFPPLLVSHSCGESLQQRAQKLKTRFPLWEIYSTRCLGFSDYSQSDKAVGDAELRVLPANSLCVSNR